MTDAVQTYTPRRASGPSPYSYPNRACRPLRSFAGPLNVLLIIYVLIAFVGAAAAAYVFVDPAMFDPDHFGAVDPEESQVYVMALSVVSLASIAERVAFLICVFFVCRFTFRAMKNLYTVGSLTPDMSPTASVVWYFIPIAMWAMPSAGMSQIHQGSVEENGELNRSNLVSYWWGAWLIAQISSILTNTSFLSYDIIGYSVFAALLFYGIAALLLRKLVNKITRLQDVMMMSGAAATFE